ncbi:peroxiredoxin [Streptococcus parauberis]|nr:peroxiredoxin [Streptococcus parauberis]
MSLVGKEILEFSADAYHNGEFITVTSEDIKGNGQFSVSTLQISLLFVQLNLVTYKINMHLLNH